MRLLCLAAVVSLCVVAMESEGARRGRAGSCRIQVQGNGTLQTGEGRRDRAQFNVKGEQRGESLKGRLDFRDRTTDARIRSRNLLSMEELDADTRRLTFALSDVPEDVAVVVVRDFGRGRDDLFEIAAGEYLASGNLRSGNIKHRKQGNCDVVVETPVEEPVVEEPVLE